MSGRVLTQAIENADAQNANRGYYENIITHKAEHRRQQSSAPYSQYQDLPPPLQTLGSNEFTTSGKRVTGVNFEMWMSPNQSNMDKRLHDFTSLQTARDLPRCDPSPLENVHNWRSSYPCLAETLDGKGPFPEFDVIMIETSYKAMSEFPPPKATLGLRLELDFGKRSRDELFDWTCTTHIYKSGVPVKQANHYRLEAKWGMVAPPFESMWWALTFIDKVEQKKQAEETGKRDVYHATQQKTQQFFSQLTAVHEIRARSQNGPGASDPQSERELVAVLLWKFSIAPETYVGTTSWQRLLPPPARITTNSPPSQQETSLPPLAMDTLVEGQHYPTELSENRDLLNEQPRAHYHSYPAGLDDANALLSHQDFEITFKEEDIAHFASMQSSFMPSSHGDQEGQSFGTIDHFDYDLQLHGLSTPSHHDAYPSTSNNLFETQHVSQSDRPEHHQHEAQCHVYETHHEFNQENDGTTDRHPLANFDHSTHNVLQVQLAESESNQNKQQDEDETLRAALAAASAMSDLGNPQTTLSHHSLSHAESSQEGSWEDVALQRPQIHTHASFTSHASYTPHYEHEAEVDPIANANPFDANNIATTLHAHDYNPSTSSPEIRRLLEMHNHSFVDDDDDHHHQQHPPSPAKQDFDCGLGGSFVLVESNKLGQDEHE